MSDTGFIIIHDDIPINNIAETPLDLDFYFNTSTLIQFPTKPIIQFPIIQFPTKPIIQFPNNNKLLLYFVITYKLSTISCAFLQSPFFVSKQIWASSFI
jgi:hypothetical protein